MRSNPDLLKCRAFESRATSSAKPQIFSAMLNEVIDDEFEAPAYTNPAQFAKSMEPSSFEYGSIWHQLLQFHVQFHSKMLQDHESIISRTYILLNIIVFIINYNFQI